MLDSQGVWSMVHSDAVMETGGLETQLQCLIALEEKGLRCSALVSTARIQ